MTEQEVAEAAADKVFQLLSTYMGAATVADAMFITATVEMVAAFGREGAAEILRKLADRTEAGKPCVFH